MFRRAALDWRSWLTALCFLVAGAQFAGAGLIYSKALLAPVLIDRAWQASLNKAGEPVRPWPWADTWPVARMRVPEHGVDLPVLAGDSGHALAFAPGYNLASAPLGQTGQAVIGGHRDTHFRFLERIELGDSLEIQLMSGEWREYRIASTAVVDASRHALTPGGDAEVLLLVTCYPFDSLRVNGPLRYVVRAVPV